MGLFRPETQLDSQDRGRDQREWVFKVREVKSENKKLSLFFEKCKVKKNAFTLFREVKSEIKMLREQDREVKILEKRAFSTKLFCESQKSIPEIDDLLYLNF